MRRVFDSVWTHELDAIDFGVVGIGCVNEELGRRLGGCRFKTKVGLNIESGVTFVLCLMDLKYLRIESVCIFSPRI